MTRIRCPINRDSVSALRRTFHELHRAHVVGTKTPFFCLFVVVVVLCVVVFFGGRCCFLLLLFCFCVVVFCCCFGVGFVVVVVVFWGVEQTDDSHATSEYDTRVSRTRELVTTTKLPGHSVTVTRLYATKASRPVNLSSSKLTSDDSSRDDPVRLTEP